MLNSVSREITSGPIWGSTFSELDILLSIALDWATHLDIDLEHNARKYQQTMQARPAYKLARAHNFSDLQIPTAEPRA